MVVVVAAVDVVAANEDGLPRFVGAETEEGFSSDSRWDGLEITGAGTSLDGPGFGAADAAAPATGATLSPSVSLIIVLNANFTALFSALAKMAAAVPYVFRGGLVSTLGTTFSSEEGLIFFSTVVFSSAFSVTFAGLGSTAAVLLALTPGLIMGLLVAVVAVGVVVITVGVGVDTVGGGIGVSGPVSESTIAVMGELENALFEDWEESSSLIISDSDVFSCSSSSGSSASFFIGVSSSSVADDVAAGSSSVGNSGSSCDEELPVGFESAPDAASG